MIIKKKLIFSLVAILFVIQRGIAQTNTDIVGVSLDHIKSYGIVAPSKELKETNQVIFLYADPNKSKHIDSLQAYQFVRYERLSETKKVAYWAPRREHSLPNSEWF